MKSWNFGGNSRPEYRYGTIYLLDQPWWLSAFDQIVLRFVNWFCWCPIGRIPLPNWPKRQFMLPYNEEWYGLRDYWGTIGDVLFVTIYNALFQWFYVRQRPYEIAIEIGWDRMREVLEQHSPDYFAEDDRQRQWEADNPLPE